MKIALFGYYNERNFGDDLMAVMFGRLLQQCNVEFSVYKLCRQYAEPHGFHVDDSIETLLAGKDMVVYGGGGILCDRTERSAQYQADRCRLIELACQRSLPVYGFSLGGTGRYPQPILPFQESFLQAVRYISVRNSDDVHWIKQIKPHLQVNYYPDIIWQTSACFPRKREQHQRLVIGIHLQAAPLIRRRAFYVPALLSAIVRLRRDIDFVLIDDSGKKENMVRLRRWFGHGPNVRYYQFDTLISDLDVLSSLDLLCSTKLHTGVACMSYGIPFISLFGHPKTKLFLDNLQLSSLYYEHRRMPALCSLLLSPQRLNNFLDTFKLPDINYLQRESLGHLEMLKRCIQN
jgi:polysaccharide pyruvyl transferase WcaK-like protein